MVGTYPRPGEVYERANGRFGRERLSVGGNARKRGEREPGRADGGGRLLRRRVLEACARPDEGGAGAEDGCDWLLRSCCGRMVDPWGVNMWRRRGVCRLDRVPEAWDRDVRIVSAVHLSPAMVSVVAVFDVWVSLEVFGQYRSQDFEGSCDARPGEPVWERSVEKLWAGGSGGTKGAGV